MTAPLPRSTSAAGMRPTAPPTPAEFNALLEATLDAAYRAALHFCRDKAEAEDLVQEAALLACRHRASFQPRSNFRAWFLKIVANAFYSRCRKASTVRESLSLDADIEPRLYHLVMAGGMGRSTDPARLFLERLEAEAVSAALASLPADYRLVTTMYLVDDFSYQEIATVLDIPVGTVRSRLHRGRRLLKRALWQVAADRGLSTTAH